MNEKLPSFLNRIKDTVVFANPTGEFCFYVPENFFNKKIAMINGEYTSVFGLLNYTIIDSNGKNNGLHRFSFESMILTKPGRIEKIKNIKLTKNSQPQDYRVLYYGKGDEILSTLRVPKNVDNAELFFKMFLYGDIPTTIPYNELQGLFKKNININGGDYGLNMQLYGILVSEVCRDLSNNKKLFRQTDMKDMTAYQMLPIKDVPKYVSPFTSITSENWDDAVVNAIVNKNVAFSPLERLMVN